MIDIFLILFAVIFVLFMLTYIPNRLERNRLERNRRIKALIQLEEKEQKQREADNTRAMGRRYGLITREEFDKFVDCLGKDMVRINNNFAKIDFAFGKIKPARKITAVKSRKCK